MSDLTPVITFMKKTDEALIALAVNRGRRISTSTLLTIATGAITVGGREYYRVCTETAAPDDLITISGGQDGYRLVFRRDATSDQITVKQDAFGNLIMPSDFVMDNVADTISFIYDDAMGKWLETGRSNNA